MGQSNAPLPALRGDPGVGFAVASLRVEGTPKGVRPIRVNLSHALSE
jgi:hypothetical protein